MNITFVILIGILASVFTAISMLPQLLKVFKNKKAGEVSIWMVLILILGLMFWVCYGYLMKDWIIVIANFFSLSINLLLIILLLKYKSTSSR